MPTNHLRASSFITCFRFDCKVSKEQPRPQRALSISLLLTGAHQRHSHSLLLVATVASSCLHFAKLHTNKYCTMGTGHYSRRKGARSKIKKYKRKTWLCNRAKDTDQIQDEIEKASQPGAKPADQFEYDDDLPGGGQFYCVETGKHFADAKALADHKKSRYYKRRCKEIKEEKYTQAEAEWASGMTKEKLPPAHAAKK